MEVKTRAQGFSLIEVLIALAVISIGALGFTRAQIVAIQNAEDSALRTLAAMFVQDMVARMQANAGETWQGLTSGYQTGPATYNVNCLSTGGAICTGNQMAKHDLWDWNQRITAAFPAWASPIASVCLDSTPGSTLQTCSPPGTTPYPLQFTIKIFWKSFANRNAGTQDQYVITTVTPPLQR